FRLCVCVCACFQLYMYRKGRANECVLLDVCSHIVCLFYQLHTVKMYTLCVLMTGQKKLMYMCLCVIERERERERERGIGRGEEERERRRGEEREEGVYILSSLTEHQLRDPAEHSRPSVS